jgi:FdrA protein
MRITLVRRHEYHDSVALLGLARELRACPGVTEAAALMGTPANRELLARSGLLAPEAEAATAADLVIVFEGNESEELEGARTRALALLAATESAAAPRGTHLPRTLASAARRLAGANLAVISVPGVYAVAEARKALALDLHVLLFSDNVSVEDEVDLKRRALGRGLLLMGPDCGTAYVSGVPLGFANAAPRGRIGLVSASGTGLQEVVALLAAHGHGPSHALGVGGRDMSAEVGGAMTLAALDALGRDAGTDLVVVIGKPPAPAVRNRVERAVRDLDKPAVLCLLGSDTRALDDGRVTTVATLEDAARAAAARSTAVAWTPEVFTADASTLATRITEARTALAPGQRAVRGLFAGGTLAHEARLILEPLLGPVEGNLDPGAMVGRAVDLDHPAGHSVVDLGADAFTRDRAHPMLDPRVRVDAITRIAEDPRVAVLLLDVVLGHGAAPDPAGDVAPAIAAGRDRARRAGRSLAVVARVVGTEADPQGLSAQVDRLAAAGAWVLPSNAQAARAAACIAGGEPVLSRLLGARA